MANNFQYDIGKIVEAIEQLYNISIKKKQRMPTANSDYENQIILYIGDTNNDYIKNTFYRCKYNGSNYVWTISNPSSGGGGGGTYPPVGGIPFSDLSSSVQTILNEAQQCLSFLSYGDLANAFNSATNTDYNIGQAIYIGDVHEPNLWITKIENTKQILNIFKSNSTQYESQPTFTVGKFYELVSNEYKRLDEQPQNWNTNWGDYYYVDDTIITEPLTQQNSVQIGFYRLFDISSDKMSYDNPKGTGSFAVGNSSVVEASGDYAHAEGSGTASGDYAHAEGSGTASGDYAHAEGNGTTASGEASHAEGSGTVASGVCSHTEGLGTKASGNYQHVEGTFNKEETQGDYLHIVGNGTSNSNRSNAYTLDRTGNGCFAGDVSGKKDGTTHTLSTKQDKLVSGENIKTINNIDILGSGNITISGGSGAVTSVAGKTGVVTLTKNDVGLGNVDNTSDIDKPISTATQTALTNITNKIPSQASSENQLADKDFVNSSIATETAHYVSNNGEPFTSVAQLEAYTGTVTNNDYAFVSGTDSEGNPYYDRYKASVDGSTVTWAKEFRLNNSSFTAAQWSAISSGITATLVAKLDDIDMSTKQDTLVSGTNIRTINNLDILGSGNINITGSVYPPPNGIPLSDLSSSVQTSLGRAQQCLSFLSYGDLANTFNSAANTDYNIGQAIYIGGTIPNLWITKIKSTKQTLNVFKLNSTRYTEKPIFSVGQFYELVSNEYKRLDEQPQNWNTNWGDYYYVDDTTITTPLTQQYSVQIGFYRLSDISSDKMSYDNPRGTGSFAVGNSSVEASGNYAHAEGDGTASGNYAHAEGIGTVASGNYAHAEGFGTEASGNSSHVEGIGTEASQYCSHGEGLGTKASGFNQHVEGRYNIEDTQSTYAHIVGNGEINNRSNAHTLDWSGNAWFAGDVIGNKGGVTHKLSEKLTTIRKSTLDKVLVSNAQYDLGMSDQASLTLTLPVPKGTKTVSELNDNALEKTTGDVYILSDSGTLTAGSIAGVAGDWVEWIRTAWKKIDSYSCNEIYVAFKSGSNATQLSIVGDYEGDTSYLPSANCICELSFKYICGVWVLVTKENTLS